MNGSEKCDKGTANNTGAYGGCNSDCTLAAYCGDGVVNGSEKCDKGTANNTGAYGGCNSDCTLAAYCGDGEVNGSEKCDNGTANNTGAYGGCNSDCTKADYCGDGIKNGFEACDKNDFGGGSCSSLGKGNKGNLSCSNNCDHIITTDCSFCDKPSTYGISGFTNENTFVICNVDSLNIWLEHKDTEIPNLSSITNLIIDGTIEVTGDFDKSISTEHITNIKGVNTASIIIEKGMAPIFGDNDSNISISDLFVDDSEFVFSDSTRAILMNTIDGTSRINGVEFNNINVKGTNVQTNVNTQGVGLIFGTTTLESNITFLNVNVGNNTGVTIRLEGKCNDNQNSNVGGLVGLTLGNISMESISVKNLNLEGYQNTATIIGKADYGKIKMENIEIGSTGSIQIDAIDCAAGVIGYLGDDATIELVDLTLQNTDLYASSFIGGIIAKTGNNHAVNEINNVIIKDNVNILSINNECDMTAACESFGGLFGALNSDMKFVTNNKSAIINSIDKIDAKGCDNVGGMIGELNSDLSIQTNQNISINNKVSEINASSNVGGWIGSVGKKGSFSYSSNPGTPNVINIIDSINGTGSCIGGLIGKTKDKLDGETGGSSEPLSELTLKYIINEVNHICTLEDNNNAQWVGGLIGNNNRDLDINIVSNVIHNFDNPNVNSDYNAGVIGLMNPEYSVSVNYVQSVIVNRKPSENYYFAQLLGNSPYKIYSDFVQSLKQFIAYELHQFDNSSFRGTIINNAPNVVVYSAKWNSDIVSNCYYVNGNKYHKFGSSNEIGIEDVNLIGESSYPVLNKYSYTYNSTPYELKLFYYSNEGGNKFTW